MTDTRTWLERFRQQATPGSLLCGADLGDGVTCRATAGDHDDHVTAAGIDKVIAEDMFKAYAHRNDGAAESFGLRRYLDPSPAEVDEDAWFTLTHPVGAPKAEPDCVSPEVDFRAMLGDDSQAWTVRNRLTAVLGRPYLATQLADLLPHDVAARLADRLDTLVSQATSELEMRINGDVAAAVSDGMEKIRAQVEESRAKLRREVNSERFRTPSRLS